MRVPDATYRIQFNPHFGFRDARLIIRHLKDLGISDLYASPVFEAVAGSAHGYDVCNPDRINPELGSEEDFAELCGALREAEMGLLLDIVPNHMAFDRGNRRLMDTLENPDSFYRNFFDIDRDHPSLGGKLPAPFLGRHYSECLEADELSLHYNQSGITVRYYELALPTAIRSYPALLQPRPEDLASAEEDARRDYVELAALLDQIDGDGPGDLSDRAAVFKQELWSLYSRSASIRSFIDSHLCRFKGEKRTEDDRAALDEILAAQNFKLSFWKNTDSEINYRRFFLINGLIGCRVEDEAVFTDTHALALKLVRDGRVTGLRIDHVDGLYDPDRYFDRLREAAGDIYIVVEKILDTFEELPTRWPVQGTTGYDFLNHLNALFCDRSNEDAFSRIYAGIAGRVPYEQLLREVREFILEERLSGDLDNHARRLQAAASGSRTGRDFTFRDLRRALKALLASFPVYRAYVTPGLINDPDRNYWATAFADAAIHHPESASELSFLRSRMLPEEEDCRDTDGARRQWRHFTMRLQQLTGALMAKGLEDTIFYRYNRLIALNEVGGDPARFGAPRADFHRFLANRTDRRPHALNATATHDTKRGEDARARLNVLSEIPEDWKANLRDWMQINRRKKKTVDGRRVPGNNTEYFLYQSLIGGLPFDERDFPNFTDRVKEYMIKAVREAKEESDWNAPDRAYEEALTTFIDRILKPGAGNSFLQQFLRFQKKVAWYGIFNSLSQTLIKIIAPGVPDFYQGTELWDFAFVDPDNRKPVDFETRSALLRRLVERAQADLPALLHDMLQNREDGRSKLFLIHRALKVRRANVRLFRSGSYDPLRVEGKHADHIIAFRRADGRSAAIAIAPRFLTALILEGEYPFGREVWQDTAVVLEEGGSWKETITGADAPRKGDRIYVGDVLKSFPVGLLLKF
jgi:(1->4)-alpha-D-glucan 1-alpha-D-glucosylmutase